MGAPKKEDWREARRRQAWELKQQGWQQKGIALALGASADAVSQWFRRVAREGKQASRSSAARTDAQTNSGTKAADTRVASARFSRDVWISGRIRDVIAQQFGLHYHRDHVRKLLREIGLSYQQPVG
jgi:putative transposase